MTTKGNRHHSKATDSSPAVITVQHMNDSRPENVEPADKAFAVTQFPAINGGTRLTKRISEIRKVKRIGGGYPYGPKNSTLSEYNRPLRFTKSLRFNGEILFKAPQSPTSSSLSALTVHRSVEPITDFSPQSVHRPRRMSSSYSTHTAPRPHATLHLSEPPQHRATPYDSQ
ncbi:hypothetical protein KIN20_021617, partial [Parelaphostrongylus tenuis]